MSNPLPTHAIQVRASLCSFDALLLCSSVSGFSPEAFFVICICRLLVPLSIISCFEVFRCEGSTCRIIGTKRYPKAYSIVRSSRNKRSIASSPQICQARDFFSTTSLASFRTAMAYTLAIRAMACTPAMRFCSSRLGQVCSSPYIS